MKSFKEFINEQGTPGLNMPFPPSMIPSLLPGPMFLPDPIDVTPTDEPEEPTDGEINPIEKWLRELHKKWKDFLPWWAPQPPDIPKCTYADCPEQWEEWLGEWFEYINDNIHDFYEQWLEHNPNGTWSEFLCDIGLCHFDDPNNWPPNPPPYWDEELHGPWPPFQPPTG